MKFAMIVCIMERILVNILNMVSHMKHADGLKEDKKEMQRSVKISLYFFAHNMFYLIKYDIILLSLSLDLNSS